MNRYYIYDLEVRKNKETFKQKIFSFFFFIIFITCKYHICFKSFENFRRIKLENKTEFLLIKHNYILFFKKNILSATLFYIQIKMSIIIVYWKNNYTNKTVDFYTNKSRYLFGRNSLRYSQNSVF